MGSFSIWHWIVAVAVAAGAWGFVRIVRRTGASLWWILPLLLPGVGGVAILWFSYADWPKLNRRDAA